MIFIDSPTVFVVVVLRLGRYAPVPAPQSSHFHGGSNAGHQVSDFDFPGSDTLLYRDKPPGMNRDRPDCDFKCQCRTGCVTHDDDLCCQCSG